MIQAFPDQVVSHLPVLRAYARHLCGNRSLSDDLVQETILRALVHADQFRPGTNLVGWLVVILRNCFFNSLRDEKRAVPLEETLLHGTPAINVPQETHLHMKEVAGRISALPKMQREALLLVAVEGESYEAAAKRVRCAVGTVKSRVSRARSELHRELPAQTQPSSVQRDLDHLDRAA